MSQSDFQTIHDELTDAKNSLVPRVPGYMLEENSDLPNLDPEGRFRRIADMRHKCRMAAIVGYGELPQELGQEAF